MKNWWVGLLLIIAFNGCATWVQDKETRSLDFYPPKFELASALETTKITESTPINYKWWITYRKALHDRELSPAMSCEGFKSLAADSNFPLQRLALLRSYEICENPGEFEVTSFEPWLQPAALQVALDQSTKLKAYEKILELLSFKIQQSNNKDEKTKWLTEALSLSQKTKNAKWTRVFEDQLMEIAPRFKKSVTDKDLLNVANDFRRARIFKTALKYYDRARKSHTTSFEDKVAAMKGIRQSYRLMRDDDLYMKATKNLARFTRERYRSKTTNKAFQKAYLESQLLLVRTLWTQQQVEEARKLLMSLTKQKRFNLSEVYWILGRMDEEKQNFTQATEWFNKVIESDPEMSVKESALWFLAWNQRKMKEWDKSIASLQELIALKTPSDKSRYRYWAAKLMIEKNQVPEAEAELKSLVQEDPLGFYGLLGRMELISKGTHVDPIVTKNGSENSNGTPKDLSVLFNGLQFEWMRSLGEKDSIKSYVDWLIDYYRKQELQQPDSWIYLLTRYSESGNFLSIFQQLGKMEATQRKMVLENQPTLLFPLAYAGEVSEAAQRFNVAKELIYAIIRQESAFDPKARSPMDAFGLMQLLPEMAQRRAASVGVDMKDYQDLFIPKTNILLGTALIRHLIENNKGQWVLAVASYNASEKAIRTWLKTRYRGDTLEFIEDIPYEETRGYVKAVMRNYFFYSFLSQPEVSPSLNQWILHADAANPLDGSLDANTPGN